MTYRYATRNEADKMFNKMVKVAQKWHTNGHSLETIAKGIWNKFGYLAQVKNGVIEVQRQYNGQNDKPFTVQVTFNA